MCFHTAGGKLVFFPSHYILGFILASPPHIRQTFCVANAKTLASVAARKQAQQESGDMHDLPLNQVLQT